MLAAARRLFIDQGYSATTIDQIARLAGVSKPTVFNAVGTKQQLLKVVRDIVMANDDLPIPVAERESVDRARRAATADEAVQALAAQITSLNERYAPIDAVLTGAASSGEPELVALWQTAEAQRRQAADLFVSIIGTKASLRLDERRSGDVLSVLMAPDLFRRLVTILGWTRDAFETWLSRTIGEQLLENPA